MSTIILVEEERDERRVSLLSHVSCGKSTLKDTLLLGNDIVSARHPGILQYKKIHSDEDETFEFRSVGASLLLPSSRINNSKLISLFEYTGNVDFSPVLMSSLRVADGAIILVDCIEGVGSQTEVILREALSKRVRPILMINKIDRALLELQLNGEDIYRCVVSIVAEVNRIIDSAPIHGFDWKIDPLNGTVIFGSGLHKWGFTLRHFATIYSKKFPISEQELLKKLWGDGFVSLVMAPIMTMIHAVMNNQMNERSGLPLAVHLAKSVGVEIPPEIFQTVTGKHLLLFILQRWLPLHEILLQMIIEHLPSPAVAGDYRSERFQGPIIASSSSSSSSSEGLAWLLAETARRSAEERTRRTIVEESDERR